MKYEENRSHIQTIRKQMILLLSEREMSARELSQVTGIREKEVYEHLSHIALSVVAQRRQLVLRPARCLVCGYVFEDRKRLTRPGRCPRCKRAHLQRPMYRVR